MLKTELKTTHEEKGKKKKTKKDMAVGNSMNI